MSAKNFDYTAPDHKAGPKHKTVPIGSTAKGLDPGLTLGFRRGSLGYRQGQTRKRNLGLTFPEDTMTGEAS